MKGLLFIVLQLASSGSDAYFTNRMAQTKHFQELNPIARPFVNSPKTLVPYFAAGAGIKIVVPRILRRRHHERLADAIALAGIADNAFGALYTPTH
ncbi:MAG: hypothetical protein JWQ87_2260 [Candidatus Sulfotelmatobacter sp.]|nr:hypothetical protein [Candidatus Sulfotelmatobacter sp.]